MISKLSDFSRNLMLSIDILPIPTSEAVKEMQARILGIESDIARWQQKQNSSNNFTASVPYELEQLRAESKEFLDDLSTRDQRMMFANVTIVHVADSLEQLDADTETLAGHRPGAALPVLRPPLPAGGWDEHPPCPMACAESRPPAPSPPRAPPF